MKHVGLLIRPRLLSFKNVGASEKGRGKLLFLIIIGTLFWAGIIAVSYRVLSYFKSAEGIGDMLAYKLLSMILITFFSLLVFSAILTSLSKLYLSLDLNLVHAMPVKRSTIFLARWIESTIDSSWMVLIYAVPVFLVYGMVYGASPFYYPGIFLTLLPLCIISSGLSVMAVLITVVILPATRIRSIFIFMGLIVLVLLYVTFRMARPERLVDPEAFTSAMIYLKNMNTPSSPFLPSTWSFDSLKAGLTGDLGNMLFHTAILWSFMGFIIFLNLTLSQLFYFRGYSKSQGAMSKPIRYGITLPFFFLNRFSGPVRAFIRKEIKTFFRDQTQWSQIFLIFALIIIYVYNYSVLPLEKSPIKTIYLQNILSFLNMGLAAFVLTSITARFTFPSISTEGKAFWIVRTAPMSIRQFLWIKFFIYLMPLLILTEILVAATNIILNVTPVMMWISTITLFFMTPGVVALGVGFGAAYPDFSAENPVQAVTGFGGLLFMIVSAAYIGAVILLEAGPVYTLLMSNIHDTSIGPMEILWFSISFLSAFAICVATLFVSIRFGEKRLHRMMRQS